MIGGVLGWTVNKGGCAASEYEAFREVEVVGRVKTVVPPPIMKYLEALCLRQKKKSVLVFVW